jgi:hypothetical protein
MQHNQNPLQVGEWMRQKQELEVRLVWDLLETFNKNPFIDTLRGMACAALDEMRALKKNSAAGSAAVTQAWQAEKNTLTLCQKYPRGVNHVPENTIDAQECSDVIRLYGTFIEQAGYLNVKIRAGNHQDYAYQNHQKDGLRKGGAQTWNKLTDSGLQNYASGRHRWKAESPTGKQAVQQVPRLGRSGQGGPSQVHSFLKSQKGGISIFILADTSIVNKINRAYGLVQGADISGTTTDSIYFIKRFGGDGLDPAYQLLPLATIVAGGHHSLLEVALSLSLNSVVDYKIGFYTSLLPDNAKVGRGEIRAALSTAERSPMNRHMLVYYDAPGRIGGCFQFFEGRDLFFRFRNLSNARETHRRFATIPTWMDEADIRNFI